MGSALPLPLLCKPHNCQTTSIDHSNATGSYYPCLHPDVFAPTDLDTEDWMAHAASLGTTEVCLTAAHEGGFALWPSNATPYSVAASSWRGGKGDVLRAFADSANKWGIKICYYLNVQCNHYSTKVENLKPAAFIEREVAMLEEVLLAYGPVNRFWFDGTSDLPPGTSEGALWSRVYDTIHTKSPATLNSAYRGDVCNTVGSLYTRSGPAPNSSDTSGCTPAVEGGEYFQPSEMHGITAQMGPDGNTGTVCVLFLLCGPRSAQAPPPRPPPPPPPYPPCPIFLPVKAYLLVLAFLGLVRPLSLSSLSSLPMCVGCSSFTAPPPHTHTHHPLPQRGQRVRLPMGGAHERLAPLRLLHRHRGPRRHPQLQRPRGAHGKNERLPGRGHGGGGRGAQRHLSRPAPRRAAARLHPLRHAPGAGAARGRRAAL